MDWLSLLPSELMQQVAQHLTTADLCSSLQTNCQWNQQFGSSVFKLAPAGLQTLHLRQRFPHLQHLDLSRVSDTVTEEKLSQLAELHHLRCLSLRNCTSIGSLAFLPALPGDAQTLLMLSLPCGNLILRTRLHHLHSCTLDNLQLVWCSQQDSGLQQCSSWSMHLRRLAGIGPQPVQVSTSWHLARHHAVHRVVYAALQRLHVPCGRRSAPHSWAVQPPRTVSLLLYRHHWLSTDTRLTVAQTSTPRSLRPAQLDRSTYHQPGGGPESTGASA